MVCEYERWEGSDVVSKRSVRRNPSTDRDASPERQEPLTATSTEQEHRHCQGANLSFQAEQRRDRAEVPCVGEKAIRNFSPINFSHSIPPLSSILTTPPTLCRMNFTTFILPLNVSTPHSHFTLFPDNTQVRTYLKHAPTHTHAHDTYPHSTRLTCFHSRSKDGIDSGGWIKTYDTNTSVTLPSLLRRRIS